MLALAAEPPLPALVVNQMVGTGVDLVIQLQSLRLGRRQVRRVVSLGMVDQNLEDPTGLPVFQELCHYQIAEDSWRWDFNALRFPPQKVVDKFQMAGIDPYQLMSMVQVAGGS
jgi:hypothetical protein